MASPVQYYNLLLQFNTGTNDEYNMKLLKINYNNFNRDRCSDLFNDNMIFNKNEDSGFDLIVPEDYTFKLNDTRLVDFRISCEMLKVNKEEESNVAYYLYPRSSIYKSDLVMMNNVGIIDKGYRGNIKAPLNG